MTYQPIIKGKWSKINKEVNRILKEKYMSLGIDYCELNFEGCWRTTTLAFAHRHKRIYYRKCPEMLSAYSETIIACTACHQRIEGSKQLTEQVFKALRPQ